MNDNINTELKQTAPWVTYVAKLKKFFEEDNDIHIEYDAEKSPERVIFRVDDPEKFYALNLVMPTEIEFGTFYLTIILVPANFDETDKIALFRKVFKNNPIIDGIDIIQPAGSDNPFCCYISFRKEVVKIWTDNLGNPYGNYFTLYQNLAEEIFPEHTGIFFTTSE